MAGKELLLLINYKIILLVEKAVKGMLPKNKLGADLYRNLKVFPGAEHSHEAQKPKLTLI